MRRSSITFATIFALGACSGHANLAPEPTGSQLRVSWANASGSWWADLELTEPAAPVLLQLLPNRAWRYLGTMQTTEGAPLAAGRHEFRVPVWACPRQAILRESGTERVELTYTEVAPTRSVATTTDVARPMTSNTMVTAETHGTASRATGLSCDAGTLPESPNIVAGLFRTRSEADAFVQTLTASGPSLAAIRRHIEDSGGRLLVMHPER